MSESLEKAHQLPDEPLVRIRPSTSSIAIDLRDLWAYRELLYFLTWRDLKVRYKQTVLGVAWAIIQPLFTMLIFTLFLVASQAYHLMACLTRCLYMPPCYCGRSFRMRFHIVGTVWWETLIY